MKSKNAPLPRLISFAVLLSMTCFAYAGHWILVTQVDSTYPTAPILVGSHTFRGNTSGFTFEVLSSYVNATHGVGTFTFFGGSDSYLEQTFSTSSPHQWAFLDYVDAYYAYTYKWVKDANGSTPPSVGVTVAANGYALQRATGYWFGQTQFASIGDNGSISAIFNATLGGIASGAPSNLNFQRYDLDWPKQDGSEIGSVSVGGTYYYLRPVSLGSGVVFASGKDREVTIYPENNQALSSTQATSVSPSNATFQEIVQATLTCSICASTVNGQPVQP